MAMYLMEIRVEPTTNPSVVLADLKSAFQKWAAKDAKSSCSHCYRIRGENAVVAILQGNVDSALSELNLSVGSLVNITTTPLRPYERFAEKVLNVSKDLCQPSSYTFDTVKTLFWCHFKVEYPGKTMDELIKMWSAEAKTALEFKKGGDLELDLFKVVAAREVHMIINLPSGDDLDDIAFNLPIMLDNGNNVQVHCKEVRPL